MTKSTITRERIEQIVYFRRTLSLPPSHDEIEELARMALAAMDSEPVAYTDEEELNFVNDMACMWTKGMGINEVPLYRHAQQPVVPEVMYWQDAPVDGSTRAAAYATGWNACRAAMLNQEKSNG